jgi:hypothetical protein
VLGKARERRIRNETVKVQVRSGQSGGGQAGKRVLPLVGDGCNLIRQAFGLSVGVLLGLAIRVDV